MAMGKTLTRSHERVNESEATVVRRIFELAAGGEGLKGIAKRLNSEGAKAPRVAPGVLIEQIDRGQPRR
jgi:hypothetical protein